VFVHVRAPLAPHAVRCDAVVRAVEAQPAIGELAPTQLRNGPSLLTRPVPAAVIAARDRAIRLHRRNLRSRRQARRW
jgi:hypothetical protein